MAPTVLNFFFWRITRWLLKHPSWQSPSVFKILDVRDGHRVTLTIPGFILLPMFRWPRAFSWDEQVAGRLCIGFTEAKHGLRLFLKCHKKCTISGYHCDCS